MEASPAAIAAVAALVISTAAAWTDARTGRIPNVLTLPMLALAPLAHGLVGGGPELMASLLGAIIAGFVPYLMFRAGAMGGGDVKLFAALGALLGPMLGVEVQWWAFIAGTVYVLGKKAYEGTLGATLLRTVKVAMRAFRPAGEGDAVEPDTMTSIRLGPAILCGLLISLVTH